jgi:hypothetical protein
MRLALYLMYYCARDFAVDNVGEKKGEAHMAVTATWRRTVLLLVTTLVAVAMLATTATPAFAGEKSEESCGASNPKIDSPAGPPSNKGNKGKEFQDCGFRNNPNEEKGFPPGQNQ